MTTAPQDFGCPHCFGPDPEALWTARPWHELAALVEDSHFSVRVVACPRCSQRFVKLFTEFVDWSAGNDAQHWDVVPISAAEADVMVAEGEAVSLHRIEALSSGRRQLRVDFPSTGPRAIHFATARLFIMPGH